MSVARVRATQRIISEKSTLFPTEKISIFKKIAVNGDFFVWTNSHLHTSYNCHLWRRRRSGEIDAESLLKCPRDCIVVQFDASQLVFKGLFPIYASLLDEASIGVVRIVNILYDRTVLLIAAHIVSFQKIN